MPCLFVQRHGLCSRRRIEIACGKRECPPLHRDRHIDVALDFVQAACCAADADEGTVPDHIADPVFPKSQHTQISKSR